MFRVLNAEERQLVQKLQQRGQLIKTISPRDAQIDVHRQGNFTIVFTRHLGMAEEPFGVSKFNPNDKVYNEQLGVLLALRAALKKLNDE